MPLEILSLEDYLLGMCVFFFHKSGLIKGDVRQGGVSSSDTKGLLLMQEVDQKRWRGRERGFFFTFLEEETD